MIEDSIDMATIASIVPTTTATDLWGIVLTSPGEGRTAPFRDGLWVARTIGCASDLSPARQLIAVSPPRARTTTAGGGDVHRVAQPAYRGSAAAVFLPLLTIARRDPAAVVAVFPGTGSVDYGAGFMTAVGHAASAIARRRDLLLVMGAAAPFPPRRGWIEPGQSIAGLEHLGVRAVRRFVRRSRHFPMLRRPGPDGIVNTGVVIADAHALLRLGRRRLPDVMEALERLDTAPGDAEEPLPSEAVYAGMPYADLSQVLNAADEAIGVLPVRRERARLTQAASA
jgi:hypothetical protein